MPEVKIITAAYLHGKYIVREQDERDWYSHGKRSQDGELSIVCSTCKQAGTRFRCWSLPSLIRRLKRK